MSLVGQLKHRRARDWWVHFGDIPGTQLLRLTLTLAILKNFGDLCWHFKRLELVRLVPVGDAHEDGLHCPTAWDTSRGICPLSYGYVVAIHKPPEGL